jgi:hypothetical protein
MHVIDSCFAESSTQRELRSPVADSVVVTGSVKAAHQSAPKAIPEAFSVTIHVTVTGRVQNRKVCYIVEQLLT